MCFSDLVDGLSLPYERTMYDVDKMDKIVQLAKETNLKVGFVVATRTQENYLHSKDIPAVSIFSPAYQSDLKQMAEECDLILFDDYSIYVVAQKAKFFAERLNDVSKDTLHNKGKA